MYENEKETAIMFDEVGDVATIATYNEELKRKLATFAAAHPELCKKRDFENIVPDDYVVYDLEKACIEINFKA